MRLTAEITRMKTWISASLAARYPARLAVGLVVGATVLSGTAVYFGPDHFQEERSPVPASITSNESTRDTFRTREELRAADRQDDLRDMVQFWNQLEADGSTEGIGTATPPTNVWPLTGHKDESADNAPNRYEVQIKRLEQQLDAMLVEAARDPSRNTPLFNREIERLDDQIEMIRLHAIKDASVGTPFSGDPGQMQSDRPYPDTEYYLNPDWRESEAAEE
jgi:hypothetical protein